MKKIIWLFLFLSTEILAQGFSIPIRAQGFLELKQNTIQINWDKEPQYWLKLFRREKNGSVLNYIPYKWKFVPGTKFYKHNEFFPGFSAFSYIQVGSAISINLVDPIWIYCIRINSENLKIDSVRVASQVYIHHSFLPAENQKNIVKDKIKKKLKRRYEYILIEE